MLELATSILEWVKRPELAPPASGGEPDADRRRTRERRVLAKWIYRGVSRQEFATDPRVETPPPDRRLKWDSEPDPVRAELLAESFYRSPALAHCALRITPRPPRFVEEVVAAAARALGDGVPVRRGLLPDWLAKGRSESAQTRATLVALLREHGLLDGAPNGVTRDQLKVTELRHRLIEDHVFLQRLAEVLWVAVPFSLVLDKELGDVEQSRERRRDVNRRARLGVLYQLWVKAVEERRSLEEFRGAGTELATRAGAGEGDAAGSFTRRQSRVLERRGLLLQKAVERAWSVFTSTSFAATGDRPRTAAIRARHLYAPRRAFERNLVGLAISGGGIRSATFGLGVLQALASLDLLRRVDYLSTVSGGGYIGGWLTSWIRREQEGVHRVQRLLSPVRTCDPESNDVRPIRFLREYSNYLAPRTGFFSADTWTLVAIWVRNTFLNQLVLVVFLALLLLVPRLLGKGVLTILGLDSRAVAMALLAVGTVIFLRACAVMGTEQRKFGSPARPAGTAARSDASAAPRRGAGSAPVGYAALQWGVMVPGFASGLLFAIVMHGPVPFDLPWTDRVGGAGLVGGLIFTVGILVVQHFGDYVASVFGYEPNQARRPLVALNVWLASLLSGAAGGALVAALAWLFAPRGDGGPWHAVAFGPPFLMGAFGLSLVLHIGLLGRDFKDDRREWWARLGAWLMIYCLAWMSLFGVAVYAPLLIAWAPVAMSGVSLAWLASTVTGVLAASSRQTTSMREAAATGRRRVLELVAVVTPHVFIAGILVGVAFLLHVVLAQRSPLGRHLEHWALLAVPSWPALAVAVVVLGVVLAVLGWRVDVNEFSMHHFYKNRLTRCYLGASRERRGWRRNPHPFTGFDYRDEVRMRSLSVGDTYWPASLEEPATAERARAPGAERPRHYVGPYHIVNTALNLVKGTDLAWQERKAQSFILTPLYAGYEYIEPPDLRAARKGFASFGYRPTSQYAYPGEGVNLGTAVAISGAAASPNMGYHSSPAAAFLMTMFNVRLGWWIGNPRHPVKWREPSPRFGLACLLNDLFGLSNDESGFVNLTDGGHFENLGIYELVRRRCRYVIACDAEQDPGFTFTGLGNAIRKCRTDFGVEIDICADRLRPGTGSPSPSHCVVGSILYPGGERGVLVYLKAALTGDEPGDVLEYARRAPEFPHQTTGDQFFDESQFESYRRLGHHAGLAAFSRAVQQLDEQNVPWSVAGDGDLDDEQLEAAFEPLLNDLLAERDDWGSRGYCHDLFQTLESIWHPPSAAVQHHFVQHAESYAALLERLHNQPWLRSVDQVLYPQADPTLVNSLGRDRFYVFQAMIALMQNVYLQLDLEQDAAHPHNAGWMRIFRQWASDQGFRTAWTATRETYGERFRRFAAIKLGLPY